MSDELPADLATAFAAERATAGPTPAQREQLRARVGASLGIATIAATAAATTTSAGAATVAGTSAIAKIVTVVVLVAGGAGAALIARDRASTNEVVAPTVVESSRSAAPAQIVERRHEVVPEPPPPSPMARRATIERPAARVESQSSMIARAWSLFDRGDVTAALDLVIEDEVTHPHGALVEERAALRVRALWRLGRADDARTARDAFITAYPRSVHRETIEREVTP